MIIDRAALLTGQGQPVSQAQASVTMPNGEGAQVAMPSFQVL